MCKHARDLHNKSQASKNHDLLTVEALLSQSEARVPGGDTTQEKPADNADGEVTVKGLQDAAWEASLLLADLRKCSNQQVGRVSDFTTAKAYMLLVCFGWCGAHHIYLGRDNHAVLSASTFNFFGVGFLRDLLCIPRYVQEFKEGNQQEQAMKTLVITSVTPPSLLEGPRTSASDALKGKYTARFVGSIFFSCWLGFLATCMVPPGAFGTPFIQQISNTGFPIEAYASAFLAVLGVSCGVSLVTGASYRSKPANFLLTLWQTLPLACILVYFDEWEEGCIRHCCLLVLFLPALFSAIVKMFDLWHHVFILSAGLSLIGLDDVADLLAPVALIFTSAAGGVLMALLVVAQRPEFTLAFWASQCSFSMGLTWDDNRTQHLQRGYCRRIFTVLGLLTIHASACGWAVYQHGYLVTCDLRHIDRWEDYVQSCANSMKIIKIKSSMNEILHSPAAQNFKAFVWKVAKTAYTDGWSDTFRLISMQLDPTGEQAALMELGLGAQATQTEIRKAYHERAREYHPDKMNQPGGKMEGWTQKQCTAKMAVINSAFEKLKGG
jgi:DnaJ-domain-containing protein 1/TM2 domain-containing membrane protein YozV